MCDAEFCEVASRLYQSHHAVMVSHIASSQGIVDILAAQARKALEGAQCEQNWQVLNDIIDRLL